MTQLKRCLHLMYIGFNNVVSTKGKYDEKEHRHGMVMMREETQKI